MELQLNRTYPVRDAKIGIMNRDYILKMIQSVAEIPAMLFFYDETKKCPNYDLIEYFLEAVRLPEDLADKITLKDFFYVMFETFELNYNDESLCQRYETDIEKINVELYIIQKSIYYQRRHSVTFQEFLSINYGVFHNMVCDLMREKVSEEEFLEIYKGRYGKNGDKYVNKTLDNFIFCVNRDMFWRWSPSDDLQEFRQSVLDAYTELLKNFLLPLGMAMLADEYDKLSIDYIYQKY